MHITHTYCIYIIQIYDLFQRNKVTVSLEKVIHYLNISMTSKLISVKVHMINILDFVSHMPPFQLLPLQQLLQHKSSHGQEVNEYVCLCSNKMLFTKPSSGTDLDCGLQFASSNDKLKKINQIIIILIDADKMSDKVQVKAISNKTEIPEWQSKELGSPFPQQIIN